MTHEPSPRTSLLHDGWGSPRPISDAELRRANRKLFWVDCARIAVMGAAGLGVVALLLWATHLVIP